MTRACSTRAFGIASVSGVCVRPIGSSPATTSPVNPWKLCTVSALMTTISTSPRRSSPRSRRTSAPYACSVT